MDITEHNLESTSHSRMEELTHRHFNKKRLLWAMAITLVTMVIEVVGGVWTNSLALLSDAAHMFSHLFSLGISYIAIILALRPADNKMTYGYYRSEILAAFVNGLTLFIIIGVILYGAYLRLRNPQSIEAGHMLIVAAFGLVVNVATAALLHSGSREDMNVKGAFLHTLGDLISSIGVVAAAILIHFTNLIILDTLVSVLIAVIIGYWAFKLIKESGHILLEGIPREIDLDKVAKTIEEVIGRHVSIHHVHVWQISTRIYALTAHITIESVDEHEATGFLREIKKRLAEQFNIHHTTIQFECRSCEGADSADSTMDNKPCPTHRD